MDKPYDYTKDAKDVGKTIAQQIKRKYGPGWSYLSEMAQLNEIDAQMMSIFFSCTAVSNLTNQGTIKDTREWILALRSAVRKEMGLLGE